MNPSYKLGKRFFLEEKPVITEHDFNRYLSIRELGGISKKWYYQCKIYLEKYLDYVDWKIDENKTFEYYKLLKNTISLCYYKKIVYQIRKFLDYLNVSWAYDVKLPPDLYYPPKRITFEDINKTVKYFEDNQFFLQTKALIYLGMTTGARPLELYQLNLEDIDLQNRVLYINHNPQNGQTTKTKRSRVTFFNNETKDALTEYLAYYKKDKNLKKLFSQSHISRLFKDAPVKVRYLRKFFSQQWTRRNGNSSVKRLLMGHSPRHDIDMAYYNAQSEEDLKRIYDNVMLNHTIK